MRLGNAWTSILRHVAEAFPPALRYFANTSMVLNCALVTYIMKTADAGLPDAV